MKKGRSTWMKRAIIKRTCMVAALCLCLASLSACKSKSPTKKERETAITVRYVGENDDQYDNIIEVNVLYQDVNEDEVYLLDLNGKGYIDSSTAIIIPSVPFEPSQSVIVAEKIYNMTN